MNASQVFLPFLLKNFVKKGEIRRDTLIWEGRRRRMMSQELRRNHPHHESEALILNGVTNDHEKCPFDPLWVWSSFSLSLSSSNHHHHLHHQDPHPSYHLIHPPLIFINITLLKLIHVDPFWLPFLKGKDLFNGSYHKWKRREERQEALFKWFLPKLHYKTWDKTLIYISSRRRNQLNEKREGEEMTIISFQNKSDRRRKKKKKTTWDHNF